MLPAGDPDNGEGVRLFRFFRARPAGINVYLYKANSLSAAHWGRVTESDPITLYDANAVPTTNGWDDLEIVFWGGSGPYTLINDWATVLTNAGYTVDP